MWLPKQSVWNREWKMSILSSQAREVWIDKRSRGKRRPAWRGSRANSGSAFTQSSVARAKIDKHAKSLTAFMNLEAASHRRENCCGRKRASWEKSCRATAPVANLVIPTGVEESLTVEI